MAERVQYEIQMLGAQQAVSDILGVQAALQNVNGVGMGNVTRQLIAATSAANQFKAALNGIATVQTPFTHRGTHSAIDLGLVPNIDIRTARPEDLATNIHELRKMRKQGLEFNKSLLRSMFGNIPSGIPKLGWNGLDYKPGSDFFWRTIYGESYDIPENDLQQRDEQAESARERLRRKWKRSHRKNPWSDFEPETYPIVESVPHGTSTALSVLNKKYDLAQPPIDVEWRTLGSEKQEAHNPSMFEQLKNVFMNSSGPGSLFKNMAGLTGSAAFIGKLGTWMLTFNLVMSVLSWFGKNLKRLVNSVKNFGDVILQATESWRQLRESHFYGTSMGSLAGQWKAMRFLGGDAASASALWDRLSTDRAMLAYGGNGGRMMEAARLFGVGILGSGEYGYATNDEFMRNVAIEMSKSSKARQKALASVLGLNAHEFWMVSNGVKYYDYVTNRRTLLGSLKEAETGDADVGKQIFSKEHVQAARQFEGAWGEFVTSLMELGGVLGEAVLPLLTMLLDLLNGIVQSITVIIEPIAKFLNSLFNLPLFRHWADAEAAVDYTPTEAEVAARIDSMGAENNSQERNVVINMGDISLSTLGLDEDSSPEDISDAVANRIFNRLGNYLINGRR